MAKVEIQKGKIDPNPKTMKTMKPTEWILQDAQDRAMRRSGQECKLYEPKK